MSGGNYFRCPKRGKMEREDSDDEKITTPTRIHGRKGRNVSPSSTSSNGSFEGTMLSPNSETRRGRPRAEFLSTLILAGSTSPSSIKCKYCNRVFPREKSLQAHLRTHTGEKPYVCTFPKCTRKFAQSGQLKTHERLHTGEKPFVCSSNGCNRRFTHANRHCPDHPTGQLKRTDEFITQLTDPDNNADDANAVAVYRWLKKKCPKDSPTKSPRKKGIKKFNIGLDLKNLENVPQTHNGYHNNNNLSKLHNSEQPGCSFWQNEKSLPLTEQPPNGANVIKVEQRVANIKTEVGSNSEHIELPKKRWLREAVQDQKHWDIKAEPLAEYINWDDDPKSIVEAQNQRRPTVLMHADDSQRITRADMQVALALVELKNARPGQSGFPQI